MANLAPIRRFMKRLVIYPLQALVIYGFIYFMRSLPITIASAICSKLARLLGPFTRGQKVAKRNLKHAFPEKTDDEISEIIKGMWDNLGRVVGEWAQVDLMDTVTPDARVIVEGAEHLMKAHESGKSFIVFSAHLANWEVSLLVAAQRGVQLGAIYRPASNPWIDKLITKFRGKFCAELIPKGREGAKRLLGVLKDNRSLALMVDQKLNEGVAVPFFGRDAMTAQAPAELALRLKCPILPVRIERLPGVKLKVTIFPPMDLPDTGDKKQDTFRLLGEMNAILEGWIRQRPEQWFWVHKRWPD